MPSILVTTDSGDVLYQNFMSAVTELIKTVSIEDLQLNVTDPSVHVLRRNGLNIITSEQDEPNQARPKLSRREVQILQCMANALTVEQSAIRMGITVRTARKYLNQARKKLDAETRDQMMARAGALGIIDPFTKDPFFGK